MAASAPSTVTFLFTDIEGSTELVKKLRDRYGDVLAVHHRLLRDAFDAKGGREMGTEGDAFFYAFDRAKDAVEAAVTAQRGLAAYPWPEGVEVRVRMGLHTGDPDLTEEGYTGVVVHRVARICAAGHGGQVLLSSATAGVATDEEVAGVALRDLGTYRLKDIDRPEHLFQLVIEGLSGDFPPLRGVERVGRRPPAGEDERYGEVMKALFTGRLVPVLGPGVNVCGRPEDAAWKPGCAYLPSDAEVAAHLAAAFDCPPEHTGDLTRVSQYIAVTQGFGPLYDELHTLFDRDYPPGPVHRFLADLPGVLRDREAPLPLIVTTGYDEALERALRESGEEVDVVAYIALGRDRGKFLHLAPDGSVNVIDTPNTYGGVSLDERPVILKIHGHADRRPDRVWESYVVSEDDYIDYLARTDLASAVPVTLAAKLRRSHFLFLGYVPQEWNLRVFLHRVWGGEKVSYRSWAVETAASDVDRDFWRQRGVDVVDADLEEYLEELRNRAAVYELRGAHA